MGDIVYREFDQDGLDAQYNCRGMVPDFEDHMARWVGLNKQAFDSFRGAHRSCLWRQTRRKA